MPQFSVPLPLLLSEIILVIVFQLHISLVIVTIIRYVISQFSGGSISRGSELQVEVAEFLWRNVQV